MQFLGAELERVPTRYGRMYLPAQDTVIGRSLRLYGEWGEHEIDVVSRHLKDGEVILDVGANIGTHAMAYAARFPNSPVFAFEPQPLPFNLLAANALLNRYANIRPMNMGCSDRTQVIGIEVEYDQDGRNIGGFDLREATVERGPATPVLLVPIDRIALPGRVQFIKVDVEGMEAEVLRGASETIRKSRPLVYFEVLTLDALAAPGELLKALDYELAWMETSQFNVKNYNETAENVWAKNEVGVLAFPSERAGEHDLPRVTGAETELPVFKDPYAGYDPDAG